MDLKFDTMEVDTKLAENFLATHKAQFEKIQAENVVMDVEKFTNIPLEVQNFNDKHVQLKALADKFQENAELIAQLEVLKRGKVKEDVLNYDLKLIVDNFRYWSWEQTPMYTLRPTLHIQSFQDRDYPLAFLGFIAERMNPGWDILLECDIITLPVVYLFAILFRQVGLKSIKFRYYANVSITAEKWFKDWNGCTAVIGEHADVDSAVDALLAATSHDPWRLHRIYVQESVYETVKSALSWKCTPKNTSSQAVGDKFKENDFTYLQYRQKKFIFDYPTLVPETIQDNGTTITRFVQSYQSVDEHTHSVFVEAYRTVKELLLLLQKDSSFCWSLWTSDVSESNEIALNVRTPLVWVNDYGALDGSTHLSQAFYTNFHGDRVLKCNEKVVKLRDDWAKLSTENRVEIITNALQKLESTSHEKRLKQVAQKVTEALKQIPGNKSFENTKGKMWINMNVPKGVILINEPILIHICKFEEAFKSVALGNILLYDGPREDNKSELLPYLCNENLPFILRYDYPESTEKSVLEKVHIHFYRSRTIVVNYGSIFAN